MAIHYQLLIRKAAANDRFHCTGMIWVKIWRGIQFELNNIAGLKQVVQTSPISPNGMTFYEKKEEKKTKKDHLILTQADFSLL